MSHERAVNCYAVNPVLTVRTNSCLVNGVTNSGSSESPKSIFCIPAATKSSLIPQRCAIRNRSCFDKSGVSVGNNFSREAGSGSREPSASLSERACRMRATCGDGSSGEVCEEDAAPRKSQRTCRRVQLMLQRRLSKCTKITSLSADTYHCGLDSSHLIRLARHVAHPVRDFRCVLRGFILQYLGNV